MSSAVRPLGRGFLPCLALMILASGHAVVVPVEVARFLLVEGGPIFQLTARINPYPQRSRLRSPWEFDPHTGVGVLELLRHRVS